MPMICEAQARLHDGARDRSWLKSVYRWEYVRKCRKVLGLDPLLTNADQKLLFVIGLPSALHAQPTGRTPPVDLD
jgi:hypothetical protein